MRINTVHCNTTPPQLIILAGPNGAGKSTLASTILPPGVVFVNADDIAKDVAADTAAARDYAAGRRAVLWFEHLVDERADFAIETTFSGKALVGRLRAAKHLGYEVHLTFLCLPSAEAAVSRVRDRVARGGHAIPEDVIRRRYVSGIRQFVSAGSEICTTWRVYDNGEPEGLRLVAKMDRDGTVIVADSLTWNEINDTVRAG